MTCLWNPSWVISYLSLQVILAFSQKLLRFMLACIPKTIRGISHPMQTLHLSLQVRRYTLYVNHTRTNCQTYVAKRTPGDVDCSIKSPSFSLLVGITLVYTTTSCGSTPTCTINYFVIYQMTICWQILRSLVLIHHSEKKVRGISWPFFVSSSGIATGKGNREQKLN